MFSAIISFILIRKQQNKELDKGMSLTTVKHPIVAEDWAISYEIKNSELIRWLSLEEDDVK